jgi:uncharacterized membrane protein
MSEVKDMRRRHSVSITVKEVVQVNFIVTMNSMRSSSICSRYGVAILIMLIFGCCVDSWTILLICIFLIGALVFVKMSQPGHDSELQGLLKKNSETTWGSLLTCTLEYMFLLWWSSLNMHYVSMHYLFDYLQLSYNFFTKQIQCCIRRPY